MFVTRLCLSIIFLTAQTEGRCKFPKFLKPTEKKVPWAAGYGSNTVVYFEEDEMRGRSCNKDRCVEFTRQCIRQEKTKYLLHHKEENTNGHYICLEFIPRSQSIVQLRVSKDSYSMDPMLCHNNSMVLDHWPIVSVENMLSEQTKCPISGGFNVKILNAGENPACPVRVLPMRLESECEQPNTMVFNFREKRCVPTGLDMQVQQQVHCIANWREHGHVFVALRHETETGRTWCMRYRDDQGEIDHVYVFKDFVCDPSDPVKISYAYISLNLERFVVSSTCSDEFKECQVNNVYCQTSFKENCPLSCGGCTVREGDPPCIFPENFRSTWVSGSSSKFKIHVYYYSLNIDHAKYQCLREYGNERKNRRLLLRSYENGCYPRYVCLEMEKPAPSVLRYRLGRTIVWPTTIHEDTICDNDYFHVSDQHYEKHPIPMSILIHKNRIHNVMCDIPDNFNSNVYLRDTGLCRECLRFEPLTLRNHFELRPISCISRVLFVRYACLANFNFHYNLRMLAGYKNKVEIRGILTKNWHNNSEHLCWFFKENLGHRQIAVVDPSNCNAETAKSVFEHHSEKVIEKFTGMEENTDTCIGADIVTLPPKTRYPTTYHPITTEPMVVPTLFATEDYGPSYNGNGKPPADKPSVEASISGENGSAGRLFPSTVLFTCLLFVSVFFK